MAKKGNVTLAWLRERTRERVIGALRDQGQTSQADIARVTGLSRTTVSKLVAELKGSGLVGELQVVAHDPRGAHGGRPPVQLMLRDSYKAVVGIDFGHSHVRVAVADLAHNVLAERIRYLDVNHQATEALDASVSMVDEVLAESGLCRDNVIGAGIGIPGPVDRVRGTAGSASILPGWVGLRIAAEMERRLELPVEIENDAN